MEGPNVCRQAIYARFDSGKNIKYLDAQVQDEERAICASSDSDGTSEIQIIDNCEISIKI